MKPIEPAERMPMAGGARHVWACPPNERGYLPGLVIDWKQTATGDWWSLVTTAGRLSAETQWLTADALRVRPGNPPLFGSDPVVQCPKCGHVLVDR